MQVLTLFCCQFLLILLAGYIIYSWLTKTPFYPSSTNKLESLLKSEKIKTKGNKFIDIGSGDGRFVIWAAKHGYESAGIEFNPFLTLISRLLIFLNGVDGKAKIYNMDFNNHDFSNYDIVYLYIFSEHMNKLKDKLFKELKPGSVIIANTFTFSDTKADFVSDRFNVYYIQ